MTRDALVVGINQYCDFDSLDTPAGDAEAIAQLLEQYGEFNVVKRLPERIGDDKKHQVYPNGTVTVAQLQQALEQLFDPKGDNIPGTALFFFAGHGHRVKNQNGQYEGFLATSESHPDPAKGKPGLSLQWLRKLLERSPVREQVVWLDCCYSGELFNFTKTELGENLRGRSRCFIAAAREFEPAYAETSGQHGGLSGALLQGLNPRQSNSQEWVTAFALCDVVQRHFGKTSLPQRPVIASFGEINLTRTKSSFVKKYRLKVVGIIGVVAVAVVIVVIVVHGWLLNGNSPDSLKNSQQSEGPAILESLKRRAEQGEPKAQTELGFAYYQGKDGAPTNYEMAFNWFNKAATKGYAEAKYYLSLMYATGQHVSKDEKKAFDLLTESAENDCPSAQYYLGVTYRDGLFGMSKNQDLALKWIGKAAAHAFGGKTVPYISPKDTQWLHKAAAEGNADAQFILGVLNETGTGGIQKNLAEALQWFQKAAAQGHKAAAAAVSK